MGSVGGGARHAAELGEAVHLGRRQGRGHGREVRAQEAGAGAGHMHLRRQCGCMRKL